MAEGEVTAAEATVPENQPDDEGDKDDDDDDEGFGPLPVPKKKRQKARDVRDYLENLPSASMYEKSYMHRDVVTHVAVSHETEFLITGSCDGHIKFWKKQVDGIVFAKHYRAHIGHLFCMCVSYDGAWLGSTGSDNTFRLFDICSCDMLNIMNLSNFKPSCCEFVHPLDSPVPVIAISDKATPLVRLFNAMATAEDIKDQKLKQNGRSREDTEAEEFTLCVGLSCTPATNSVAPASPSTATSTASSHNNSDKHQGTVDPPPQQRDSQKHNEQLAGFIYSYRGHSEPVHMLRYNRFYAAVVSFDKSGQIDYWDAFTLRLPARTAVAREAEKPFLGGPHDQQMALGVLSRPVVNRYITFNLKSDTDLFELSKNKTFAVSATLSNDGELLALMCEDSMLRVYRFRTGNLCRVYDESIDMYSTAQSDPHMDSLHVERFDFGRRLAIEKELRRSDRWLNNDVRCLSFDETNEFLIYPSMMGIKVLNIMNNKVYLILGKMESNDRFLSLCLYQGKPQKRRGDGSVMISASGAASRDNMATTDPTIFCTAYKKSRFYCFSRREPPAETHGGTARDILNEKPTKEELAAMTSIHNVGEASRLSREAVLHTTVGDVCIKLFPELTPRTNENFTVHCRNGYYDNCIFHRVIRGFMAQTGDPNGDGTGGESIWGGEFEDEFNRALKHDRPYTVSMANAGPNTNGSQFFITTVPCSWLDNKHTVFGRVMQGMDVIHKIENVRTNSSDKPYEDIRILTIKITVAY